MIVAGTGHRPNKLGGYSQQAQEKLIQVAVEYLVDISATQVISGMALGWDTALAEAAILLDLPFIAAVPHDGHGATWPDAAKEKLINLYAAAQEVVTVCPGEYAAWKMQKRNEWMVEHCDRILALWNGTAGGTKNCIDYAINNGFQLENMAYTLKLRPIINCYQRWLEL